MRRRFAFLVLVALTLACWSSTPTASYAWGHHWGGWGGYGGYGGWGWGRGWGWGGLGYGGWGYGGYGGWGGYGYPGWGYGGWGWGGYPYYVGSYGMPYYSASPYYASNIVYTAPVYATASPAAYQSLYPATTTAQTPPQDRAYIRVQVPANAQVSFDDTPMHETGSDRLFQTPPLQSQTSGYSFKVTARWMANGKEHSENRTIRVTPGRTTSVNFLAQQNSVTPAAAQPASQPVRRPGDVR